MHKSDSDSWGVDLHVQFDFIALQSFTTESKQETFIMTTCEDGNLMSVRVNSKLWKFCVTTFHSLMCGYSYSTSGHEWLDSQ